MESRPYQQRIIKKVLAYFLEEEISSVMIESPVGSGKTIMALSILNTLHKEHGLKAGWVAMRRNLLVQAELENAKHFQVPIAYISMFEKNPPTDVDLLVIDEAHHDATDSCMHLHNTIKPRFILGLTGTPYRTDRVKLCFEKVVKDAGIKQLISQGYLSPYKHWTIPEWGTKSVVDTFCYYRKQWGKTLMFFHTLADCYSALKRLNSAGIQADVVTGSSDRDTQIERFKSGAVDVLVNCMVLTEGFDFSGLRTVFVRPSHKGCTIQMGGRVFRKHPDIEFKNIVQDRTTPWPFPKTALPLETCILEENTWLALTPKTKEIERVNAKIIKSISTINIELPKLITDKQRKARRRFGRQ